MNRRAFLSLAGAFAAGCAAPASGPYLAAGQEKVINAGPAGQFLADGVYTRFRDVGFFLVRRGSNLFALSAICTHRKCKLASNPDQTFTCPCHGSTFDPNGLVTKGPARRNLPSFTFTTDAHGNLLVTIPTT